MKKVAILFILFYCFCLKTEAQNDFSGSFLMTFSSENNSLKDYPMLWNIEKKKDGGKMAMEIQDEMIQKGVSKRILFDVQDSTWTMLMEFNKVKQGSRIHAANMFRENDKRNANITVRSTNEKKIIEGFKCHKVLVESPENKADVWITDKLNFDLCRLTQLLSHCGMMSEYIRKGDWYFLSTEKEMVLEVDSKNKKSGEKYQMRITEINRGNINPKFFSLSGFRISDIPEGQNCGVAVEEKEKEK